jgi:hypothetical protein
VPPQRHSFVSEGEQPALPAVEPELIAEDATTLAPSLADRRGPACHPSLLRQKACTWLSKLQALTPTSLAGRSQAFFQMHLACGSCATAIFLVHEKS